MKLRQLANIVTLSLLVCAVASAATIDYTITFTGGGLGILSIGPGSFSYDSAGASNTVVGPPVTLPGYDVPVTTSPFGTLHFAQTSPSNDSAVLNGSGRVTAVSLDSDISMNLFLVLGSDNTWSLICLECGVGDEVDGVGTYTISSPAAVPEPASFALITAGLLGSVALRRRTAEHAVVRNIPNS